MPLNVRTVSTRNDLKRFIELPYRLYRNNPVWIPPLRMEQKKLFRSGTNPMLLHCEVCHFLVSNGKEVVGRVSAFVDSLALEHWKDKVGLFGSYECIDDFEASKLLLEAARSWLKQKGMLKMRGPWSFASQEWGVMVKGFESPPMIMAPHNHDYYEPQMQSFGLKKVKDLLVYDVDSPQQYELPDRFIRMTDRVIRKYGVVLRPLCMRRMEQDVKTIVDLANQSTQGNWGYIPVTDEEAKDMAESLKPIVDPNLVLIAEIDGRPIGYLIALPDINTLLRGLDGRLFPLGLFRLLFQTRRIRQYRIWALGVIPEYLRRAVDTLFYRRLYEVLIAKGVDRLEANYVLEDNMPMNNPLHKMGFKEVKRYRVLEMKLT